jgi:type IV secretion system protein VirB1
MLDAMLLQTCAPMVAPQTINAIVQVESHGNPYAIHINHDNHQVIAHSKEEAIMLASQAISLGKSVDMGLMQVNSQHLRALGLSAADVFEPCTNIKTGASILIDDYKLANLQTKNQHQALLFALSAYNTGDFEHGLSNGYVAKYASFMKGSPSLTSDDAVTQETSSKEEDTSSDEDDFSQDNPYTAIP